MALPSGYKRLAYIRSTGTQCVDLDIRAKSTLDITVDFQLSAVTNATQFVFYGGDKWAVNYFGIYFAGTSGALNVCYNTGLAGASGFSTPTARHEYRQAKNKLYVDGTLVATTSSGTFTGSENVALFAGFENGSVVCHSSGDLYSCQCRDNDTLVRDLIPCQTDKNEVGLWDDAGLRFYGNVGSGSFIAGPVIEVVKQHQTLVDGVEREFDSGTTLLGGVTRDISFGSVMVGGVGRTIELSSGEIVRNLAVGDSVFTNLNGINTEFIVVNQGKPSSLYDDSCDGTWLLAKDIVTRLAWKNTSALIYAQSESHAYLNGTFMNLFDPSIRDRIKTVKIPYLNGDTESGTIATGSAGLSTRAFLLSGHEVGWTRSQNSNFPITGSCLSYFEGTSKVDSKRIANYNGSPFNWWLRDPQMSSVIYVWNVYSNGDWNGNASSTTNGIRPAIIAPFDMEIDENFNLVA